MVRMQVRLTEQQSAALKERAQREGVSVSALIRRAVDRALAAETLRQDHETIRRAIAAAGSLRSGASDLAANHDEYLVEAYSSTPMQGPV